jgi:hypothetical protein
MRRGRYLELVSMGALIEDLDRRGIRGRRRFADGRKTRNN